MIDRNALLGWAEPKRRACPIDPDARPIDKSVRPLWIATYDINRDIQVAFPVRATPAPMKCIEILTQENSDRLTACRPNAVAKYLASMVPARPPEIPVRAVDGQYVPMATVEYWKHNGDAPWVVLIGRLWMAYQTREEAEKHAANWLPGTVGDYLSMQDADSR